MTRPLFFVLLVALCLPFFSGCVAILDATSSKPLQTDPHQRSFGGYLDDRQLRTIIAVNIKKTHEQLELSHVNVYSFNSVVLLTGEVPSNHMRELAGETARKVNRVRQVHNELTVNPNTNLWSRSADNWIQTKIKTKLMFNRDIDASRVKVIVENRTVYLMGLLTQTQTEKVTNVVRSTGGVSKVVRAIEYVL